MIDPSLALLAERIEDFLGTSRLGENYSPLPASTYHMTIYSIYQCGNRLIPPVERWMNASGATVSNSAWLPAEVLQEQNEKAMCIIDKYLKEPLRVKFANLLVNQRAIKLSLEMDEESLERIRNARREFAKIYEDRDWSMEPINEKLHVQLAYVYAPTDQPNWEESNQLNAWGASFNGQQFQVPSVYLFDSMINYVPYQRRRNEIECWKMNEAIKLSWVKLSTLLRIDRASKQTITLCATSSYSTQNVHKSVDE